MGELFSLEGMRAVVTGAGAGNGRAIALAVARQGADVFLASLYETELGEVLAKSARSDAACGHGREPLMALRQGKRWWTRPSAIWGGSTL